MKTSLQTHNYDGKLGELPQFGAPELEFKEVVSRILSRSKNLRVHKCLKNVMASGNYDPVNKLNAETLLCLVWDKLDSDSFELLESVLEEIVVSGPCVQGRTVRLYQLLLAL